MAANYFIASQIRDVRVLGPSQVTDVERVGIRTKPSGVYAEYPLPLELWLQQSGYYLLDQIATGIEQQISEGLAIGGSAVQDFDAAGLLVDYVEFVVQYVPTDGRPPMTTTALVPVEAFLAAGDPFAFNLVDPLTGEPMSPGLILTRAYDALVNTAGH